MLVLSRKYMERIVIDGGITITVVAIRGDKVRLGVEAPQAVSVHREEVAREIEARAARRALIAAGLKGGLDS
jgi:carbon storage regulator